MAGSCRPADVAHLELCKRKKSSKAEGQITSWSYEQAPSSRGPDPFSTRRSLRVPSRSWTRISAFSKSRAAHFA